MREVFYRGKEGQFIDLQLALPHLLLFAGDLDQIQQQVCQTLGKEA